MATLEIEIGGRTYRAVLPEGTVRVGRAEAADLRIDQDGISAAHFRFEPREDGSHLLVDDNSGRPTKVNGAVVKRVALKPGDVVEAGPARLVYEPQRAPARPRPLAPPPPPPAAVAPPPVPAPVPVAPRAPAAVPAPATPPVASAAAAAPAAPAPSAPAAVDVIEDPADPRPRRAPGTRSLKGPLVGVGVAGGIAIVAALLLSGGGSESTTARALDLKVQRASDLRRERRLREAEELYAEAARGPEGVAAVDAARRHLEVVRRELEESDRAFEELSRTGAALDADAARRRFEDLRARFGDAEADRHRDLISRLATERSAAFAAKRAPVDARVAVLLERGDFAGAWSAWGELERAVPGEDARRAASDGRTAVAAKAGAALEEHAARAAEVARKSGPAAAAAYLRERAPSFQGLPTAATLAERAAAFDRAAATAAATGPAPAPTTSTPKTTGDPAKATERLAAAEKKAGERKVAEALAAMDEALAALPSDDPRAPAARGRRDDLRLAVQGIETLVRSIRQQPAAFVDVHFPSGLRADLIDGDPEHVVAAVRGARTRLPWSALEPATIASVAARASPGAAGALELAALLHVLGQVEARDQALLAHVKAGGDLAALAPVLARWRGEPVPAGGYVVHENAVVSPAERDRRILEAKVARAATRVGAKDAKTRAAAYEELFALGEPAKAAFARALRLRREDAAKEVATAKAFTSPRTRARLQEELVARRAAALALIEDGAKYPYPSPTHEGQAEVDRLVDAVREVWERPFDVVAAWEPEVSATLVLVAEVDQVLGKLEPGYSPAPDAVKGPINRAIDVPGIAPDEDAKKVLAFNERIPTTATEQERDNVRAVNEYRIMMGRSPLKLHERLLRAARGHSIHMAANGYFAHESPDPALRNPGDRARRQGYGGGVGENIARGPTTGRDAFDGWFHSSGHHRNMLGKGWTEMGCGRSNEFWTQLFGAAGGKSLDAPEALPPPAPDVAPVPDAPAAPGPGDTRSPDAPDAPE